jgi:hypothetical protein
MSNIEDYAAQQRAEKTAHESRIAQRGNTRGAFWDGAGATLSGGNSLPADLLSNGPLPVGQSAPLLLADGRAIVDTKSRQRPGGAFIPTAKKSVLILLSKYDPGTLKTRFYLCGDRRPQLIYENETNEFIDFHLEIDGVGRDAWVVCGARYLAPTGPNPIPTVREIEVVTIRQSGTVLSPKVPVWVASSPYYSNYNRPVFLGNASWAVALIPVSHLIDGGLSFSFPKYDPILTDTPIVPGDTPATLNSAGSLYTGEVTPTQDPFSRSASLSSRGVLFDFGMPSQPLYSSFGNLLNRTGLDLGNDLLSPSMSSSTATINPTSANNPDCGIMLGQTSQHRLGQVKILSHFIKESSAVKHEGTAKTSEDYEWAGQRTQCASNTNFVSSSAFARGIANLFFTANDYVLNFYEQSRLEEINFLFQFSSSYPPVNIAGTRNIEYFANAAPQNQRTFTGTHIASVFNGGASYFFQTESASESGQGYNLPFFLEPPLSGIRQPIQIVLSPGSAPITPIFPTGQDNLNIANISTGFLQDSETLRARKRWRVENGQLFIDNVVTPTIGAPGIQTELDRFSNGESVSVQVLSYSMSASGQFTKVNQQKSKLLSIAGTEAVGGIVREALYYGN